MDRLLQIEAFVAVAQKGNLSSVARQEGVTPAIIGRRLDALEARLGVKLLMRSTRRTSVTPEGSSFLEECQRILLDLADAEAAAGIGSLQARGHIRMTAPAGFGRRHVAPLLMSFLDAHPDVSVSLDLSDRTVDLVNEGFDLAIRIGDLPDSSLVSVRLADNQRVVVGSREYLETRSRPETPSDLANHACLCLDAQRGWTLLERAGGSATRVVKVGGALTCNDGSVLLDWVRAGKGLAWRSMWEVGQDIASGSLLTVLDLYAAAPLGIFVVMPQRKLLPARVRLLLEFLRERLPPALAPG